MVDGWDSMPAIVLQGIDSSNLSPPALSDGHGSVSAVYCRQNGERLGESNFCKTMADAVPSITDLWWIGKV